MADDKHNDNGKNDKKGGDIRVPPRTWLLWIGLLALVPLVWKFHSQVETKYRTPSYVEFKSLVTNNLIVKGTINYNPQSEYGLREITGRYWEVKPGGEKTEVPFKLKIPLLPDDQKLLLESGKFETVEPNALLLRLFRRCQRSLFLTDR